MPGKRSPALPQAVAHRVLSSAAVHPIFHSFKRLYWSSMRFARDWAKEYGITPARFDVLIIIGQGGDGIAQGDIHRRLDVTAPVISRMLDSLEELGLVVTRPHPKDGRMHWMRLTEHGRSLLRVAVRELLYEGFTERCLWLLVAPDATCRRAVERAMRHAREWMRRQRRYLVDTSTHRYPCYLATDERSPDFPVATKPPVLRLPRLPRPA